MLLLVIVVELKFLGIIIIDNIKRRRFRDAFEKAT